MKTMLMFWDYDTQWGGDRSRSGGGPRNWGGLDFENTERLLEIHAAYEVRACFAVVGAAALPGNRPYHDPAQIRRIHAAGHEIASHSFHHDWLPGLDAAGLRETLRRSKEALEDCIGAAVRAFVPPYNQPFDYARGLSFSVSERREAGPVRTDLTRLCAALAETGYQFCRVAYRPWPLRLAEKVLDRPLDRPRRLERIEGVVCARLNTPGGFDERSQRVLRMPGGAGSVISVYGHPHSASAPGSQSFDQVKRLLEAVAELRAARQLEAATPSGLISPAFTNAREAARAAG